MNESVRAERFERTMVPHLRAAYNLAAWMTRSPQDAEDLVQEAFVRALRHFDGFRGGDERAWLLAIVRNTCLTWLRRSKGGEPVEPFDEQLHGSASEVSDPEKGLLRDAAAGSLRKCIDSLPLEYREAIVLRELEEMSYKEIAEVTATPPGTVMSRLNRARKRLADCMRGTS